MVWLTVVVAVVLQTSFMHPPFGIALYNLRSVAPATVRTTQIYAGAIPFVAIQLLMAGVLFVFPGLAINQTVQIRATEQEIEDALRPPPAEVLPEPAFLESEKK